MLEAEQGSLAFDTERQQIGSVYANALLSAARNEEGVDQVLDELNSIVGEVLSKLDSLNATLCSPRISMEAKESLIDKAFGQGSRTIRNFLKVVCRHGRFDSIAVIARTANAICDELAGRVEATLITAETVNESLKERVAERLRAVLGQEIRLKEKLDPSIIGGIVIKIGDTVYDGSVVTQLQQVKNAAIDQMMQQIRTSSERFVVDA